MIDLLVIAGEHSGDNHAALFVRQLKERHPQMNICAVGGPALKEAGAHLLFDLTQYAVVGLVETLKHYRFFKTLLDWIVQWVRVYKPKTICLVDFPGFNLALAKKLYQKGLSLKSGGTIFVCQYIAPQIWAWKAKRRFAIAKYIDHLGTIFPFEKDCFRDVHLDVQFVGHPLLETKNPFHYDAQGPLLLLPGSRISAVKRVYPILAGAFRQLKALHPNLVACIPTPNEEIYNYLSKHIEKGIFLSKLSEVHSGFSCALMSSGTASLQVALAGIPGVITYRANPVTFFVGKNLVKIPYLSMANILLNRPMYTECLQNIHDQASVVALQAEVILSTQELSRQKFLEDARALYHLLSAQQIFTVTDWIENYC